MTPTNRNPHARSRFAPALTLNITLGYTALLAAGCGSEPSQTDGTTAPATANPSTSTPAPQPPTPPTPPNPPASPAEPTSVSNPPSPPNPAPNPPAPPPVQPSPPAPDTPPATTDTPATSSDGPLTSETPQTSDAPTGGVTEAPPTGSDNSDGCGSATAPESGRFDITVDGETREYIVAVPSDYDPSKPYRLVFAWHPWGGSADQVAGMGANGYYGLQSQSNGSAIFVAPEGLDFGGNGKGWGNEGGKDLAFFDAMLARFESEMCVDRARVFSVGFSFGGMFSWALGCGRGSAIRAIAPMAGNTTVSGCLDGDAPVAVMGFHGDDDTVVAIDGGRAGRDEFVARNHCGEAAPSVSKYCDGVSDDRQPCTCVDYQGCDAGYPVTWCEFNGPHTPAPNSGATIWNFFAQF